MLLSKGVRTRPISCPGVYRSKINLCPGGFMKLPLPRGVYA